MEQAKLVGIGFMGRPDRVTRLLNKVVKNANRVYDIPIQGNLDNALTGFYLGFTKQTLNLSLYIKSVGRYPGKIHNRITCPVAHKKDSLH